MIWLIGDLLASNHHVSGCFFGFAMRLVLKLARGVLLTRMFNGHGAYSCRRGTPGRLGQHLLNALYDYLVDA
jgi:hypothetical protein